MVLHDWLDERQNLPRAKESLKECINMPNKIQINVQSELRCHAMHMARYGVCANVMTIR